MIAHRHNGLVYYSFESLAPFPRLKHGVFTRNAPPELAGELNFSFRPEIPVLLVQNSLTLARQALGLDPVVMVNQTHSAEIFDPDQYGPYSPKVPEDMVNGYDAVVTKEGKSLLIKLADCQGILLFHPTSDTLALVHSGWRGSKQNILGRTITFLETRFMVPPAELLAAVSPSLGPCCAEFVHYREELPYEFWAYRNPRNDHFDFWAITKNQLMTAGLKPQNIEIAGICTKCQTEFFSYRRGDPGRFGFMAGVKR